ncbi:MAG TPA: peptidylprolyl isomerase [Candidatus Solibacter sp.]|nr:peptidylprolyl isomerase [Candidatus Solibacter sp.]
MIRTLLVLALAATSAMAQSQNSTTPPKRPAASPGSSAVASSPARKSSTVGANAGDSSEAVITIQGLCTPAHKAAGGAAPGCVTVITKAQFDALLNTINPSHQPIPQAQRQQLAQRYVELLTFAEAARKAGIENKPQFQATLRVQRIALLQQIFLQDLEEQFKNPSQQEIEKYYSDNQPKFEEVKLHRIFIPKSNPSGQSNKEEYDKKAPQVANDLRERAAKGEDPDKLQKEAYDTLSITSPPMSTDLGKRKRGMFPPAEEQDIFALKAGEASKVESGASGWVVYKVDSKETIPLEKVKDEISRSLSQQKIKTRMDSIRASVHPDFNKEYFAPPAPAVPPPTAAPPTPKPGTPPAPPSPGGIPATPPASPTPGTPSTPPNTPAAPPPSPSAPPK